MSQFEFALTMYSLLVGSICFVSGFFVNALTKEGDSK